MNISCCSYVCSISAMVIAAASIGWLHSRSRSQWRVKMSVFFQICSKPSSIWLRNLVLWCIIMSRSVMQKDWFAIFKIKVTARAHSITIWQFLLYPLKCWSFCYQNWFDSTLLWAGVPYEEILGSVQCGDHSKISKCQWSFVQTIFSELLNRLLANLM